MNFYSVEWRAVEFVSPCPTENRTAKQCDKVANWTNCGGTMKVRAKGPKSAIDLAKQVLYDTGNGFQMKLKIVQFSS